MRLYRALLCLLLPIGLVACAAEQASTGIEHDMAAVAPVAQPGSSASGAGTAPASRPLMVVHKTPWCGCCSVWAEQAEAAGFAVELRDTEDLNPIKRALGVPAGQASCHTAEVDGYFVEGHVPFEDVHRLLAERPAARGIAVPGMPAGSPGMESDAPQRYRVNLVAEDGSVSEYAIHNKDAERTAAGHHHH
jgi:hypothetical protein